MVDWTKPIVIAATDWQDELPARVVEGPTEAGNYRVSIGERHKTKPDGPLYEGDTRGWYFTPRGKYLSGGTSHVRVVNKVGAEVPAAVLEEKIMEPKEKNSFVVGQKYYTAGGREYTFIADTRDVGISEEMPLLFLDPAGSIGKRKPDGKDHPRYSPEWDIILPPVPRNSVSTFLEEQSLFFNVGQSYHTLDVANSLFPTVGPFPVAEMKRQGNEMVFVKMHYPEDAE